MNKNKHYKKVPTQFNSLDKALIYSTMFELGVIPMENPVHDMNIPLQNLSPEDVLRIKRKFRKLWRKCLKNKIKNFFASNGKIPPWIREKYFKTALGFGKNNPSKIEKLSRKRLVLDHIWKQKILPTLEKIDKIDNN